MPEVRVLLFLIWGLGCAILYGIDFVREFRVWRTRAHDRRADSVRMARRELLTSFGLFLVALASMLSIGVVLFGEAGAGYRGVFIALSLGAFFAVGVNRVLDPPKVVR